MDKPKCKLCGTAHYLNEDHLFSDTKSRQSSGKLLATRVDTVEGKLVPAGGGSARRESVRVGNRPRRQGHCPTCTCEGRKVYPSAAERQRAYRERQTKGKKENP